MEQLAPGWVARSAPALSPHARFSAGFVQGPGFIAQDPLSDRLFVAEYEGRIYSFLPAIRPAKKDLFLDMGRGISAFSFHPKYKENGYIFVFSHADMKLPRESNRRAAYRDINWSQVATRRACVPNRK